MVEPGNFPTHSDGPKVTRKPKPDSWHLKIEFPLECGHFWPNVGEVFPYMEHLGDILDIFLKWIFYIFWHDFSPHIESSWCACDLPLKKAEDDLGGNLSWNPPEVEESLEGYVVYLANSATGNARVWWLGVIHDVFPKKAGFHPKSSHFKKEFSIIKKKSILGCFPIFGNTHNGVWMIIDLRHLRHHLGWTFIIRVGWSNLHSKPPKLKMLQEDLRYIKIHLTRNEITSIREVNLDVTTFFCK